MNWKNIKITNKIGIGIGTVVFLLGIMSIISYFGVEGIVLDAGDVIAGNRLSGTLAQKEVDTCRNRLQAASGKAIDLIQSIRRIDMPGLNQKQEVLNSLKYMRFGTLEEDHFFVLDTNGVVVMPPLKPSLAG